MSLNPRTGEVFGDFSGVSDLNGKSPMNLIQSTPGTECLVYGRWQHGEGDELVIIRCDEALSVPQLGSTTHVTAGADRLHHFDTATGKRI